MTERSRIALLARVLGAPGAGFRVGIGDDAAVLSLDPGREELVWTIDAAVEDVHFRRAWLSFHDLGYRATMAAASDLAAMGARPVGLLAGLVLPRDVDDSHLKDLAEGQREAAAEIGTTVVGGNLAAGAELSITTTAIGAVDRAILRAGARPGDEVWLAGEAGLAAAGLAWLGSGRPIVGDGPIRAVDAWRRPRARITEGLKMKAIATAAIDVSDGLAADLGHVAAASGVAIVLGRSAIVTPGLVAIGAELELDPLRWALRGGEEYAIAFTAPPGSPVDFAARIGRVVRGPEGEGARVWIEDERGGRAPVDAIGFDHFGA